MQLNDTKTHIPPRFKRIASEYRTSLVAILCIVVAILFISIFMNSEKSKSLFYRKI